MRSPFALVLALAVAGCTQSGNLLDITATPTLQATHYEVFWLEPAAKVEDHLCIGYDGQDSQVAQYFARIPDEQMVDAPRLLPSDFTANGLTLLVENHQAVRAVVVLLTANPAAGGGYNVVGIGDSGTALAVSSDRVRQHAIKVDAVNPGDAEYIIPTKSAVFPGALRWHVSKTAELRVGAFADPLDFDGDDVRVVLGKACPTKDVRTTGDCDDAASAVFPQADNTCGRLPDLDCNFDELPMLQPCKAVTQGFCQLGEQDCSDGQSGRCAPSQFTPPLAIGSKFCTTDLIKEVSCRVHRGLTCSTAQASNIGVVSVGGPGDSVWVGSKNESTFGVFGGPLATTPLSYRNDIVNGDFQGMLSIKLLNSRDTAPLEPLYIGINRLRDGGLIRVSFDDLPCQINDVPGVQCP